MYYLKRSIKYRVAQKNFPQEHNSFDSHNFVVKTDNSVLPIQSFIKFENLTNCAATF